MHSLVKLHLREEETSETIFIVSVSVFQAPNDIDDLS